jgi:murein DD-endopeptidase MepM/ murein hydrolase activator NlpD
MDGPFAAGESAAGWYLVTDGGVTGYVDGDYLAVADQPSAPAADADPVVDEPLFDPVYFAAGDYAATDGGVNVRSGASIDSNVLTTLVSGAVVEVLAGPDYDAAGDGWYLVSDGSTTGYANGNFLAAASAPAPPPPPPAPAAGTASGTFIVPVSNYVFTQAYGCSPFVFEPYDANLGCNFHNGIDLANVAYSEVLAADGGVVKYAGWCDCGLGYYVEIDHGNGYSTVYGHMAAQPYVAAGQAVAQGDVVGPMGSTGLSTGSHVHFMIKLNGSTVDPLLYVAP